VRAPAFELTKRLLLLRRAAAVPAAVAGPAAHGPPWVCPATGNAVIPLKRQGAAGGGSPIKGKKDSKVAMLAIRAREFRSRTRYSLLAFLANAMITTIFFANHVRAAPCVGLIECACSGNIRACEKASATEFHLQSHDGVTLDAGGVDAFPVSVGICGLAVAPALLPPGHSARDWLKRNTLAYD
jgi:hypothetical protein